MRALRAFRHPQPEDAILLFTDADDNSSTRSHKQLEAELQATGIRLFSILMASDAGFPGRTEQLDQLLSLVRRSGGTIHVLHPGRAGWGFDKPTQEAIQALRRFWKEQVMNGYLLRVQVPANAGNDQKWNLSINRDFAPGLKNAVVLYPDRLRACRMSAAANR